MYHPLFPLSVEEASVCLRMIQGYSGRSLQIVGYRIHQGGILSRLTDQCSDGQESQQKVKDVCRLYELK